MRKRAKDDLETLATRKQRRGRIRSAFSLRRGRSDESSTAIFVPRQESRLSDQSSATMPDLMSSSGDEEFLTSRSEDDVALYDNESSKMAMVLQPVTRLTRAVLRRTVHKSIDVLVALFSVCFSMVETVALSIQRSTLLANLGLGVVYLVLQVLRMAVFLKQLVCGKPRPEPTAVVAPPPPQPQKSPRWQLRKRSNRRLGLKRQNSGI